MAEFLFDTNALLYVIATKNYQKLDGSCHVLGLTFYEYGNALLNILTRRKGNSNNTLSKEETVLLMQSFQEIAGLMPMLSLQTETMQPIFELAEREELTFYDASYLYCSQLFKYSLVSGDGKLIRAALNNSIEVIETRKWIEG